MSLLSQTGHSVVVLEEGPRQSVTQVSEAILIQASGEGPYAATTQIAETALIVQESSFTSGFNGLYELSIILQESPDADTPFVGQVVQETLIQSALPLPEPAFVIQLAQLHLFVDRPAPATVSGIQSATIILQERALPVPALMNGTAEAILIEEPIVTQYYQTVESALIEEQPPLNGIGFSQAAQAILVTEEAATNGVVVPQVAETALVLTQKPLNDTRLIETHHLALHVDISGITTLSNTVGVTQIVLVQAPDGAPQPDPTRARFVSTSTAINSLDKYPIGVQSPSKSSAVLTQAAIVKLMPQQVQSFSNVFAVASRVARKSAAFIDPSQLGSFVQSSNVISSTMLQVTKQRPSTIHSMSVLRGVAHFVARQVAKTDPELISSTEQIPSVVMQTPMRKQYGPAGVNSSAQQSLSVMPTVIHKNYAAGENIQSNSVMKKMSRLVSRTLIMQPLDLIRSPTVVPIVSSSFSRPATFMNPDDIRPILSLSGMNELMARTKVMPLPTDIFAPVDQYSSVHLVAIDRDFLPPDTILGSTLYQYAMVKMIAVSTFYSPPESVDVVRREVYGTYYSELDNN